MKDSESCQGLVLPLGLPLGAAVPVGSTPMRMMCGQCSRVLEKKGLVTPRMTWGLHGESEGGREEGRKERERGREGGREGRREGGRREGGRNGGWREREGRG